jgi:hypothetical protein
VNGKGEPSVECWDLNAISESMQMERPDGSKGVSHALSLAHRGELEGVDILTWPSVGSVWPGPPFGEDSVHSKNFDLRDTFKYVNPRSYPYGKQSVSAKYSHFRSLFNVQGGLIQFSFYAGRFGAASVDEDEVETHIFNMENGDDWFYFEDSTYDSDSLSSKRSDEPYPFQVSTISATETMLNPDTPSSTRAHALSQELRLRLSKDLRNSLVDTLDSLFSLTSTTCEFSAKGFT